MAFGLALTVLMVIGAIGGVSADLGSRQALAAAATVERLDRIHGASTVRLTAQAELYSTAQRAAALDAALAAIADAGDVVVVASGMVQAEEVSPLDEAVAELKTALEGDDIEAIKTKQAALMAVSQKIGEAVYAADTAAASAGGEAPEGEPAAASGSSDEDVVDAEIVDEDEK